MQRKLLTIVATLSVALLLCGFTSFTQVRNVCPKCPSSNKTDVVVFNTSMRVKCNVVAENAEYYVLERYGELRAALKTEVKTIEWKAKTGAPTNLNLGDQILTNNNVVYHGTITGEQKGRYFEIQVGTRKHLVWYSQIKSVHRGGVSYQFRTP